MTYGISVLVSDIPANLEVGLSKERYFKCGDMDDLKEKIADQTIKVYEKALVK